jgi:hypothetical protein
MLIVGRSDFGDFDSGDPDPDSSKDGLVRVCCLLFACELDLPRLAAPLLCLPRAVRCSGAMSRTPSSGQRVFGKPFPKLYELLKGVVHLR